MAKIFIVDDDPDVVEAARMFLEKAGHQVSSAGDRQSGMDAIEKVQPDLLILDVMLDEADDGMVMARDLRGQGFTKPILMLSSIGKVTGLSYGKDDDFVPVDEFQEKPIEPQTLVSKVNDLLGRQAQKG